MLLLSLLVTALAVPPAPVFSLTPISDTIINDPPGLLYRVHRAGDLLVPSYQGDENYFLDPGPGPDIWLQGDKLTWSNRDFVDIDALSKSHPLTKADAFYLSYSVDLASVGWSFGGMYSILHQTQMKHQEGDLFLGLASIRPTLAPFVVPDNHHIWVGGFGSTHAQVWWPDNQTDLDLAPRAEADTPWLSDDLYDDVDALEFVSIGAPFSPFEETMYYTVTEATAGATLFADNGSDILRGSGGLLAVWATRGQLGLTEGDDIDALIVFDNDSDYDPGVDLVLISLTRNSPSLAIIGATGADVLRVNGGGQPTRIVNGGFLGIRSSDELNAMAPWFDDEPFAP